MRDMMLAREHQAKFDGIPPEVLNTMGPAAVQAKNPTGPSLAKAPLPRIGGSPPPMSSTELAQLNTLLFGYDRNTGTCYNRVA